MKTGYQKDSLKRRRIFQYIIFQDINDLEKMFIFKQKTKRYQF